MLYVHTYILNQETFITETNFRITGTLKFVLELRRFIERFFSDCLNYNRQEKTIEPNVYSLHY